MKDQEARAGERYLRPIIMHLSTDDAKHLVEKVMMRKSVIVTVLCYIQHIPQVSRQTRIKTPSVL